MPESIKDMLPVDEIVKRSYKNCHVQGLYGLVLKLGDDTGNGLVRMFYAEKNHVLGTTLPYSFHKNATMPLAIHGHRNDLVLNILFGKVINQTYRLVPNTSPHREDVITLDRFEFTSAILNGAKQAKFVKAGTNKLVTDKIHYLGTRHKSVLMFGNELHTVYVPKGEEAAWLVIEGKPTLYYNSSSWSNDDLTKFPFDKHYGPVTKQEVETILKKCRLIE